MKFQVLLFVLLAMAVFAQLPFAQAAATQTQAQAQYQPSASVDRLPQADPRVQSRSQQLEIEHYSIRPYAYEFKGRLDVNLTGMQMAPGDRLYFARLEQNGSATIISEVKPANGSAGVDLSASYGGNEVDSASYVLVLTGGSASGAAVVKRFDITYDWGGYLQDTNSRLDLFALGAVPIFLIAVFVVILVAYHRLSEHLIAGSLEREYSIFIPLAVSFILAVSGVFFLKNLDFGLWTSLAIFALSGISAFLVPFLVFIVAWLAHSREGKPLRMFTYAFLWGACSAIFALAVTTALIFVDPEFGNFFVVLLVVSPFVEELLKALGIFTLSLSSQFDDEFTGFLLGLAVGTGFAFIENWYYFSFRTNPFSMDLLLWLWLVGYRSIANTIAHSTFASITGLAMGFAKWHFPMDGRRALERNAVLLYGILLAMFVHAVFNVAAIADSLINATVFGVYPLVLFNPGLAVLFLGIVLVFYWKTAKVNRLNIIWHDLKTTIRNEPKSMKFPK